MWNKEIGDVEPSRAPPAFLGLRDDLPITVYEQVLPHWRGVEWISIQASKLV